MTWLPPFSRRRQAATPRVEFGIAQPVFPITTWQGGSTNRFQIDGRLTVDGRPVANAQLKANDYSLPNPTGTDGTLSVRRDQTVVDRTVLRVVDTTRAMLAGAPISADAAAAVKAAAFAIESVFTIKVDQQPALHRVEANITITGTATFADGTPIPPVALWGYTLTGAVKDDHGAPLAGVFVSVSDDEGETWALSNQTGADGRYQLRFYPVTGGAGFTIRIAYGDEVATSDTEVTFPPETSSVVDLIMMKDHGRVMGTGNGGAFAVKPVAGAEYVGYLVGLSVDDKPLPAALTWPDTHGRFMAKIASLDADGSVGFFQLRARFFSAQKNAPGSEVPTELIPTALDERTPRGIPPLLAIE